MPMAMRVSKEWPAEVRFIRVHECGHTAACIDSPKVLPILNEATSNLDDKPQRCRGKRRYIAPNFRGLKLP